MKQVMNPAPAEERPAKRGRGRGEGQERRGRRGDRAADKENNPCCNLNVPNSVKCTKAVTLV